MAEPITPKGAMPSAGTPFISDHDAAMLMPLTQSMTPSGRRASPAPRIEAVNATGSGDSTIAGFAHAIAAGSGAEEVLRCGNTCGTLNAMDPQTGHLVMGKWDEIYQGVEISEL